MDTTEKLPENDAPVVIEDDVWTGANVTILKGVTIGRGSIIAADAVVTKSFPPYSIIDGVPAKVLKMRFSEEEIEEHEEKLRQTFTNKEYCVYDIPNLKEKLSIDSDERLDNEKAAAYLRKAK